MGYMLMGNIFLVRYVNGVDKELLHSREFIPFMSEGWHDFQPVVESLLTVWVSNTTHVACTSTFLFSFFMLMGNIFLLRLSTVLTRNFCVRGVHPLHVRGEDMRFNRWLTDTHGVSNVRGEDKRFNRWLTNTHGVSIKKWLSSLETQPVVERVLTVWAQIHGIPVM